MKHTWDRNRTSLPLTPAPWPGNAIQGVAIFRIYADFPWTEVFGIFEFPDLDTSKRDQVGYKGAGFEPTQSFNHDPATRRLLVADSHYYLMTTIAAEE